MTDLPSASNWHIVLVEAKIKEIGPMNELLKFKNVILGFNCSVKRMKEITETYSSLDVTCYLQSYGTRSSVWGIQWDTNLLEMDCESSLYKFLYIKNGYSWFGWVLWHINHCRLFNAKSSLYIYIKYIWFDLVGFYGISTIVGYLMPNPLYTYILNIYDLVWLGFMAYQPL